MCEWIWPVPLYSNGGFKFDINQLSCTTSQMHFRRTERSLVVFGLSYDVYLWNILHRHVFTLHSMWRIFSLKMALFTSEKRFLPINNKQDEANNFKIDLGHLCPVSVIQTYLLAPPIHNDSEYLFPQSKIFPEYLLELLLNHVSSGCWLTQGVYQEKIEQDWVFTHLRSATNCNAKLYFIRWDIASSVIITTTVTLPINHNLFFSYTFFPYVAFPIV